MLIRFTVKNFLSFNEKQEFSMIAGRVQKHPEHVIYSRKLRLLKFASIFGANASGKSNLVLALDFVRSTILHELPPNIYHRYCRTNPENQNIPSEFEFEIKIGNKVYAYGFDVLVNTMSIVGEWLSQLYPDGTEEEIFTRQPDKSFLSISENMPKGAREILERYGGDMISNDSVLFLSEMNRNKNDLYTREKSLGILQSVFRWFKETLCVNYPESSATPAYFLQDENLSEINTIISSLGLGINSIEFESERLDEVQKHFPPGFVSNILDMMIKDGVTAQKSGVKRISHIIRSPHEFYVIVLNLTSSDLKPQVKKLIFKQSKNHVRFEFHEESDGTKRLLDLIEIIIAAKSGVEKTYVIDEIDRCIHPQVTYRYIQEYLDSVENKTIQLIVTTHESHLMDLRLLRRDEIWFVEKNMAGDSRIYSLDEYNTRFDKKIQRAYFDGRYGGVPLFDTYFPPEREGV